MKKRARKTAPRTRAELVRQAELQAVSGGAEQGNASTPVPGIGTSPGDPVDGGQPG